MHEANMIQRIALYTTLGLVLNAVGVLFDTWGFWCILALYWCSEAITRREGFDLGVAAGISAYSNANEQQRADLDKIVKSNHND
jgi:hypothetical protein